MTSSASTALDSWSVRYVASSLDLGLLADRDDDALEVVAVEHLVLAPDAHGRQQEEQARQHDEQSDAPTAEAPTAFRLGASGGGPSSPRRPSAPGSNRASAGSLPRRRTSPSVGPVSGSAAHPRGVASSSRRRRGWSTSSVAARSSPRSCTPSASPVTDVSLPCAGFSLDAPLGLSLCLCFCLPFAVAFGAVSTSSVGTSASFGSAVGDPATSGSYDAAPPAPWDLRPPVTPRERSSPGPDHPAPASPGGA